MNALPKFLDHDRPADPLAVLVARAEARALLVQYGQLDLIEAVDGLQDYAMQSGLVASIGQDLVQEIIGNAFAICERAEAAYA
jgi:hypothetical protein